jgi:uncharacterized protein (DUF1778 family)
MSRQVFATRLHPEERALVAAAARAVGLLPSGFLRQAALREAALIVISSTRQPDRRSARGRAVLDAASKRSSPNE